MVMPESNTKEKRSEHSIKLPYLYKEGSRILQAYAEKRGTLKSLVFATRQERLYKRLLALVCRAVDNRPAVDAALSSVGLLTAEPGLVPHTARLLTAELLFGTGQLASEARPVQTVLRYADRLRAAADRAGAAAADRGRRHPRYARVNTLLTSVDDVINQLTTEGWEHVQYSLEITYDEFIAQIKSLSEGQFLLDLHVPCLLVFPPGTELHQHPLYRGGQLILQDKASCLPPVVLAPSDGEHVLDACAAPGMKTSQLAAMMDNRGSLTAVERDNTRFNTLSSMLKRAGVTNTQLVNDDFLRLRPEERPQVTAILLDPSCSGIGMVGREPEPPPTEDRLRRLANLQGMLLRHALSFPAVRRVVYSTCSVTEEENEQVVSATLAAHPDWRLAAAAPATWRGRGRTTLEGGERCIRADSMEDLCHGFFVAAFEKVERESGKTAGIGEKKAKKKKRKGGEEKNGDTHVSVEVNGGHDQAEPLDPWLDVFHNTSGAEGDGSRKRKKRKRCEERRSESAMVSEEVQRSQEEESGVEGAEVHETEGTQSEGHKKKKKKGKRGEGRQSESAVVSKDMNGGLEGECLDGEVEIRETTGVEREGPRKKKKRKLSEPAESDEVGAETVGLSCNEKKLTSAGTDRNKSDGSGEEAPIKKKKKKRNEAAESAESDLVPPGENKGKKRRDSSEPAETLHCDKDIPNEGRVKKKKKKSSRDGMSDDSDKVSGQKESIERSEVLKSKGASCDSSVGAEKSKKRKRKHSDEKEETYAVPAKKNKDDGICVDGSTGKTAKKRKRPKRLSKRRRVVLKMRKPAPITTK